MNSRSILIVIIALSLTGALIYLVNPGTSSEQAAREDTLARMKQGGKLSPPSGKSGMEKVFSGPTVDFEELHRRFPGNRALPALTPEENEKLKAARKKRNLQAGKILSNRASDEEVNLYYREQMDIARDVLQLLNFILDKYDNRLTELEKKKYNFAKEQFENRVDMIPGKEKEALERIHRIKNEKAKK